MKYLFLLILMTTGCDLYFDSIRNQGIEPFKYEGDATFVANVNISKAEIGWNLSIVSTSPEEYQELSKFSSVEVVGTLINANGEALNVTWMADSEEEKLSGNVTMKWDNGREQRGITMYQNQEIVWHVGPFDSLLGAHFLRVGTLEGNTNNLNFILKLEFDELSLQKLGIDDFSNITIPISAHSTK